MAYSQTFKGILVYESQESLKDAMELVQGEAAGADLMAFHNSFYSDRVLLLDISVSAPESAWQENEEAIGILAENARRGFVVARFEGREPEMYVAGGDGGEVMPTDEEGFPGDSEDYFFMSELDKMTFRATDWHSDKVEWTCKRIEYELLNDHEFYCFPMDANESELYNPHWNGYFFFPQGGNVYAINKTQASQLRELDLGQEAHLKQLVYRNAAEKGEITLNVWPEHGTFSIYTYEGNQDVETPYGTFENARVIRVDKYQFHENALVKSGFRQFFAQGRGLVAVEYDKGRLALESVGRA